MAQAVRRSPPTAGVPSSRLGRSMWFSWWTKRSLGRFFSWFLLISTTTNFIPSFLHTHLIQFVSFLSPCVWCDSMVGRNTCYLLIFCIGASLHLILDPSLCRTRAQEEKKLNYILFFQKDQSNITTGARPRRQAPSEVVK